jgi:hypothetical protein
MKIMLSKVKTRNKKLIRYLEKHHLECGKKLSIIIIKNQTYIYQHIKCIMLLKHLFLYVLFFVFKGVL